MHKEAILHENTIRYVHAKSRKCLTFCLRVGRQDIKKCSITYLARTNPEDKHTQEMRWKYRDDLFDYYEADITFSKVARYTKYYFSILDNQDDLYYLTAFGIVKSEPENDYFEHLYTNDGDVIKCPSWASGQIFYQIFPERFCNGDDKNDPENCEKWGSVPTRENFMGGDLEGIRQKVPYMKELGIECIYLNPIFKADFNHKYATTDYFDIDPIFGTKDDFRKLVDECHKENIRIILDGVFNHSGVHFGPFEDVLKNQEQSEYKDWFYISEYPVTISHHKYECVGAYKWMPKLNTSNSKVREYFINVMEYWIKDFGIDGWRLDVADEVDKSVWTQARILLKEKYPNTILLGETWGCAISMMMGDQMDSAMNYMFRDSVRDYLALDTIDEEAFDARLNRILSTYFGNSKHQLYNLLDSHDTERFLYFAKEDKNKLKLAAAMQMLFPGSPAVYYGDEIGMTGDNDPDCRRAMEWDTNKQDLSMLEWYRTLIKLRKSEACIRNGEYATVLCSKENHLFGFVRYNDNQSVYAIFNNSNYKQTIDVPVLKVADYKDCLTGEIIKTEKNGENDDYYNQDVLEYEGRLKMCVEPYSMKVIKQN